MREYIILLLVLWAATANGFVVPQGVWITLLIIMAIITTQVTLRTTVEEDSKKVWNK